MAKQGSIRIAAVGEIFLSLVVKHDNESLIISDLGTGQFIIVEGPEAAQSLGEMLVDAAVYWKSDRFKNQLKGAGVRTDE